MEKAAAAAAAGVLQMEDDEEAEEEEDPMAEWQLLHIPVLREYLLHQFSVYLRPAHPRDFGGAQKDRR